MSAGTELSATVNGTPGGLWAVSSQSVPSVRFPGIPERKFSFSQQAPLAQAIGLPKRLLLRARPRRDRARSGLAVVVTNVRFKFRPEPADGTSDGLMGKLPEAAERRHHARPQLFQQLKLIL